MEGVKGGGNQGEGVLEEVRTGERRAVAAAAAAGGVLSW